MTKWTAAEIPDQTGRTVLITGANAGLGLVSARTLAAKGAKVLLACRSRERGSSALQQVAAAGPAEPELVELDLADLSSVRGAAEQVRGATGDQLDVLMNNAGVMAPPHSTTRDGFELQIGTNHLGHAALTWLLAPALKPGARVVTLSSVAHLGGGLDLDDLNFERRRHSPFRAYSQSKLANLLFALELDRAARREGRDLVSTAAHPGMASTELINTMSGNHKLPALLHRGLDTASRLVTQSPEQGALPQLHAATAPGITGGTYYGPDGFREYWGHPKRAAMSAAAQDESSAKRLWDRTAELTGITPSPR
jgi:protochlorophyllide reductase